MEKQKIFIFFCLLAIIGIASFFRLWQLDKIPPGLYPDVAIYANDGLNTLKTGNFNVFYPENNGREGLYMWLLAFSFWIFDVSVWSIKIVTATIGILTVLGLYLLTKELFSRNVALLSSFFLATSFWHTNFSRIGFRAILVPFVLVFAFYFLFRGFRAKTIVNFIISGIFFGLGAYTYISYRFVVFLVPVVLIPFWLKYRKNGLQKKFLFFVFCFLFFSFLVAAPILLYFLHNPHDFFGRANDVSVLSTKSPIKELGKSLILHLGMFNVRGDQNWRHNFSGSPMLPFLIGLLFLIGLVFSLKEIFKKSKPFPFYFLVSGFFIMLGPGFLSFEGAPHALRTLGAIPFVYMLSGLGGVRLYQFLNEKNKTLAAKKILIAISVLFLAFSLYSEFNKYFFVWAKNPNVEGAFTKQFADIGHYLNSLPEDMKKYVVVNESGVPVPYPNGIPMPAQTIMFIENSKYGKPRATYLLPENTSQIKIESEAIVVPMRAEAGLFEKLKRQFPDGEKKEENGIWIFQIKK